MEHQLEGFSGGSLVCDRKYEPGVGLKQEAPGADERDMTHETAGATVGGKVSSRLRSAESEFLTAQEVAEITNLHVAVVRRAIDRGDLRAYKLCSRLRIRREDYNDWIERNTVAP